MTPSNRSAPRPRPRPRPRLVGRAGIVAAVLAGLAVVACATREQPDGDRASRQTSGRYYRPTEAAEGGAAARRVTDMTTKLDADQPIDDRRPGTLGPGWAGDQRKVIRTGQVELVVAGYDQARDRIELLVTAAGGYVDSTRVSHSEGQVSDAVIVIRVPAKGFAELLPRLRELGEVRSETTDAADITDEYVDLDARLDAARALEKRLLELSQSRTGTVAEVLEVERELARVRGEIEQYQGRLRLWDDQVAMSSLTLVLTTHQPEIAAAPSPGFGQRASRALDESLATLRDAGQGLAVGALAVLPWLPLLIPALFLGWRLVRRRTWLPRAFARPLAYPAPMAPPMGPPMATTMAPPMAPPMATGPSGEAAAEGDPDRDRPRS